MAAPSLGAWPAAQDWELEAWHRVLARMDDPLPFGTPEWQRAWWEHFGDGALTILPFEADREIAGVGALVRDARGCARFLGGRRGEPDLVDYPGPAIAPGGATAVAEGLIARLRGAEHGWRALELRNARPEDGLARALLAAADRAGLPALSREDEPIAVLELPRSYDAYLEGLARRPRHELRRKERRLQRELPGARVRTASPAAVDADAALLCRLMRQAPGAKGAFMSARVEAFFRRVASDCALRLDILEHGDRPLAVAVGLRTTRAHHLYNMAFDRAIASLSPGMVLLAAIIRQAIDDGLERFDFMRGLERYKLELGGTAHRLDRVTVSAQ